MRDPRTAGRVSRSGSWAMPSHNRTSRRRTGLATRPHSKASHRYRDKRRRPASLHLRSNRLRTHRQVTPAEAKRNEGSTRAQRRLHAHRAAGRNLDLRRARRACVRRLQQFREADRDRARGDEAPGAGTDDRAAHDAGLRAGRSASGPRRDRRHAPAGTLCGLPWPILARLTDPLRMDQPWRTAALDPAARELCARGRQAAPRALHGARCHLVERTGEARAAGSREVGKAALHGQPAAVAGTVASAQRPAGPGDTTATPGGGSDTRARGLRRDHAAHRGGRLNAPLTNRTARRQRGVALITAILIVALATILATQIGFDSALEQRRSAAILSLDQAFQVALGAEAWAASYLKDDADNSQTDFPGEKWATPIPPIPIDGGQVEGFIEDMQGRFNLNNLITPQGAIDDTAVKQFRNLLTELQLEPKWADILADWLDTD